MIMLTAICLVSSALCLGLGLTLPLVQFEKLYFFTETPSLLQITGGLFSEGSFALGCLVAIFSILFPFAKILAITASALGGGDNVFTQWLSAFSKWSLLDVLLVAIFIFAAKTSGLATAISQPGVWFFAASTLFATIASTLVTKRSTAVEGSQS
jgi:paraquat-inducible protein A